MPLVILEIEHVGEEDSPKATCWVRQTDFKGEVRQIVCAGLGAGRQGLVEDPPQPRQYLGGQIPVARLLLAALDM